MDPQPEETLLFSFDEIEIYYLSDYNTAETISLYVDSFITGYSLKDNDSKLGLTRQSLTKFAEEAFHCK